MSNWQLATLALALLPVKSPEFLTVFIGDAQQLAKTQGAGLGLTIVQQLLLRCGGSISVTSRLGKGSNFKVLLPVASWLSW
jgi:two-component system phosphate regulon sensor histidine kinase PhoR